MASEHRLQMARESVAMLNMMAPSKKETDCQFFLQSKCSKGEQCEFRHQESAKTRPPCSFWMQGQCKQGVLCPFRHPSMGQFNAYGGGYQFQPQVGAVDRSTTPCAFFARGQCFKGAACPFMHQEGGEDRGVADTRTQGPPSTRDNGAFGPPPGLGFPASAPFGAQSRGPASAFGNSNANAPPVPLTGGSAPSPFAKSPFANPRAAAHASSSGNDSDPNSNPGRAKSRLKDRLGGGAGGGAKARLEPKAGDGRAERTVGRQGQGQADARAVKEPKAAAAPPAPAVKTVRSKEPGVGLFSRAAGEVLNVLTGGARSRDPPAPKPRGDAAAAPMRRVSSSGDTICITASARRTASQPGTPTAEGQAPGQALGQGRGRAAKAGASSSAAGEEAPARQAKRKAGREAAAEPKAAAAEPTRAE
eukprot:CAMPEP_0118939574 /NCGR_PEP_ID=MMETSP1169-20130426/29266_1 /TAXON_ID=36882 /ORGANISM="Pyramimonas obovata, Strain CCMP722" /LENGTH=417 /DNA_ID=CAMNT_0006883875 /DNA_START=402 /DNA_END=1652 /DNA_ORIENTATION=-